MKNPPFCLLPLVFCLTSARNVLNRYLAFLLTLTLISGCAKTIPLLSNGENSPTPSSSTTTANQSFSYDDYAEVLKAYVSDRGLVDYNGLQANRQHLERFNASIGAVSPATYQAWSDSEKIAFLINAYNAFTLQSIIDQKPLKASIRDIPGVWKRRKFKIAGQEKTLDNIEHDTLRTDFSEPRIHVALVCAAISCPTLRQEPYTADKLDRQLDDQVQKFIASPHGFRLDRQQGQVYLSSIFKWFGDDWKSSYAVKSNQFTGSESERSVLNFLSNALNTQDKEYLRQGNYKINYLDYNWTLNKQ